jgi:hypothetical protein
MNNINENKKIYNAIDYGVSPENKDNSKALQTLIDIVYNNGGGTIFIPSGIYVFDSAKSSWNMTKNITAICEMKSNVSLIGESITDTILKVIGNTEKGSALFCHNLDFSNEILHSANAQNFTVDMSEASLNQYTHRGKAFYYSGISDCIFRDLRLISTPSTALGIDMLNNVVIDSIYVFEGGRSWTYGGNGGAGIGIGTGMWKHENYIIRNCICESCGHFGIFLEDQGIFHNKINYPKGQIISNNIIRDTKNYAIGIRGGDTILVSANNLYDNVGGLYVDYGAKNIVFNGNVIKECKKNAFCFGNEDAIINKNSEKCENIIINSNTFIKNRIIFLKESEPISYIEQNNVFTN